MIFHAKIGILGEYLYASHTVYFISKEIILYLEKNYTLFGNLAVATLNRTTICLEDVGLES